MASKLQGVLMNKGPLTPCDFITIYIIFLVTYVQLAFYTRRLEVALAYRRHLIAWHRLRHN